ncbi:hypothetical protein CMI37_14920 [Candidatus Pacearchaeota archaeon]|nr:hypothetical protein [Candidatus Pacearchaeota archaeon]
MIKTWRSAITDIGVDTDIYASGDALGVKSSFASVPAHGVIRSVIVIDRDKESVSLDLVLFSADITGTAANAAFDPTDAELDTCVGAILVDTYKAFNDNSIGQTPAAFEGLPYWAPAGVLYFQCVTRGTPTYTAATDMRISIQIEY